jgi:hypothetical protein
MCATVISPLDHLLTSKEKKNTALPYITMGFIQQPVLPRRQKEGQKEKDAYLGYSTLIDK